MSTQLPMFAEPDVRTVDPATTDYVTTTELTIEELQALARGDVPPSLQVWAREWLVSVTGTTSEWLEQTRARRQST